MRRRTPLITVPLALAFATGSALIVAGCEEEWEEGLDQVPEPREQAVPVPEDEDPHIQDDPRFQHEPAPLVPEHEADEYDEPIDAEPEVEDEDADQDSDADEFEQAY